MHVDAIRSAWISQRDREPRTRRSLRRRRWILSFAALGAVDSIVVALRQTGIVRHLPDPPGGIFQSDRVTTSRPAYVLGAPDATLGAAGFSGLMVLASAFGTRETGRPRAADVLMAIAATGMAGGAL